MVYGHSLEPRLALERQVKGSASPTPQTSYSSGVGGTIWEHPTCPAVGLSTFLLHPGEAEAQPYGRWEGQMPKNPPSKRNCIPRLQAAFRAGCARRP